MSESNYEGIQVIGAREHNLKNISVKIPRNKISVITGLSGSGKSSVAFDIVYAEGQRRYVESLSAFARNFLEQMKKPDVDAVLGLSPSIAIDQKTTINSPRSTVGTITEIYDFMRLLYSRIGTPKCPIHKVAVSSQKPSQIIDDIFSLPKETKFYILAPVVQDQKGEFLAEFQKWARKGFLKARIDGQWVDLENAKKLEKHKRHNIELLIDRLKVDEKFKSRLSESINLALTLTKGTVKIEVAGKDAKLYSIHQACPICGFSFPELDPRLFSFNNPRGACKSCNGLGYIGDEFDANDSDDDDDSPELDHQTCPECKGTRLSEQALNVTVCGKDISELAALSAVELQDFIETVKLSERDQLIGGKIFEQIKSRLSFLKKIGTGYLSMNRPTRSLSGGEIQRIRLATQVGSSLIGVLYVLDEPSIGLHPRDHHRLLNILQEIRDRGNTILMVEHDEDSIRTADHVIDLGPGAGIHGGSLIAEGTPADIIKNKNSITGQYLAKTKEISTPKERRKGNGKFIRIEGARGHNLKNISASIPLGLLCGVTGVSGSGKSTLILDTLFRACTKKLYKQSMDPAAHDKIEGLDSIDRVIEINQKPIGRTPRSTPATYVGVLPMIRDLYSTLPEAKIRGYKPGHFSFNVKGGRCETCQGHGQVKIEMHFMSDLYVECDRCYGQRYNHEVLSIRYKEKSVADVLAMTVEEATKFFENHQLIKRKLETLQQVGLGYLTLGQSSTTVSGGEAQRIKLSRELSKRGTGNTLYILDEPTTGLHFEDINKLVELFHQLVNQGNTVVIIEHHLDVVKNCDHLIDLGPDGGNKGGEIVAIGTPEAVAKIKNSPTGQYLAKVL